MTRKEKRVSIKIRPNGKIYIAPDSMGDIIIYEDQLLPINEKVSKCKSRTEASNLLRDFRSGIDIHHSDIKAPVVYRKPKTPTKPSLSIAIKRPQKIVVNNEQKVKTEVQQVRVVEVEPQIQELP